MTTHRRPAPTAVLLPALALALLLGACAAPPATRWYSLQAAAAPTRVADAPAPGALVLQIEAPQLPRQLDQPQWLVRRPDASLLALEHERWSTPLGDELRAALAARLVQHWGVTDARLLGGVPAWRLSLQVLRFETGPGREVQWDSAWSLAGGDGKLLTCVTHAREPATAEGYPGLAAAHRAALDELADQIGTRLLLLRQGQPATCVNND